MAQYPNVGFHGDVKDQMQQFDGTRHQTHPLTTTPTTTPYRVLLLLLLLFGKQPVLGDCQKVNPRHGVRQGHEQLQPQQLIPPIVYVEKDNLE